MGLQDNDSCVYRVILFRLDNDKVIWALLILPEKELSGSIFEDSTLSFN